MFHKVLAWDRCFRYIKASCLLSLSNIYQVYTVMWTIRGCIWAFKPDDSTAQNNAMAAMEECLHEIRQWMMRDSLLINDDKTEFALIGTNAQLRKVSISTCTLRIGDAEVHPSIDPIRNLGVGLIIRLV